MRQISRGRRRWLDARCRQLQRKAERVAGDRRPRRRAPASDTLVAPRYLALWTANSGTAAVAPREFLRFLGRVRAYRGPRLTVDLSGVERIIASAALVFKAELCYLTARGVQLRGVAPSKERSLQVFTQTGICDLLGLPRAGKIDREDIVHWRHTSGVWTTAQPARLKELLHPDLPDNGESLYTGMIETVANSIEHAYLDHPTRRDFGGEEAGWWAFQQLREGRLTTCICDLGIGVAEALPLRLADEPDLLAKLLYLQRHFKGRDCRALLAAMEYGRSSTRQSERGKGLRDAVRVIDHAGQGVYQLVSNSALYFYERVAGNPTPKTGTRRLAASVSGTLSLWSFPIESQSSPQVLP